MPGRTTPCDNFTLQEWKDEKGFFGVNDYFKNLLWWKAWLLLLKH